MSHEAGPNVEQNDVKGAYGTMNTPVQSVMEQPGLSQSAVSTHPHHYS